MKTIEFLDYIRDMGLHVGIMKFPAKIKVYRRDGVIVAEVSTEKEVSFQIFEGAKNIRGVYRLINVVSVYSRTPIGDRR